MLDCYIVTFPFLVDIQDTQQVGVIDPKGLSGCVKRMFVAENLDCGQPIQLGVFRQEHRALRAFPCLLTEGIGPQPEVMSASQQLHGLPG